MRAFQRTVGAITSVLALALLLGIVAGIPLLLVVAVGWPLPRSLPSWNEIAMWFQTQGIDESVVLRILAVLLWILWAYLIAGLVAQAVAGVRGTRSRGRRRWTAPSQRFAGLLVGLVLLGVSLMNRPPITRSAGGSLRSSLTAPQSTVAAPLHAPNPAPVIDAAAPLSAPTAASTGPEVEVRAGDTLWGIAGREYGNPTEWPHIWDANQGEREDDGRTFTDPSLIYPGWELDVPEATASSAPFPSAPPGGATGAGEPAPSASQPPAAGASGPGPAAPPSTSAGQEVEVRPGDTLWGIAVHEFGSPTDWPRIWEANEGQQEDNGEVFTDPHWIDPGWELEVPDAPPSAGSPASLPTTAPPTGTVPSSPVAASPAPTPAVTPAPAAQGGGPTPATHTTGHPQSTSQDWAVTLAEGGSIAALTAAALAALLLAAQRHERWRRRAGDLTVSRVSVLARRPSLRRIRAAVASASVLGAPPEDTHSPKIDALQADLERLQAVPGRILAGHAGPATSPVLVDVDQLHRLALTGPGAEGAARALLVALLAHHGIESAQAIVAQGAGPALLHSPTGTPGMIQLSIDSFLAHLEREIRFQRDALERDRMTDWHERLGCPDPLPAYVALVRADDLSAVQLERLGAAADAAHGCAIAVVLVGPLVDAPWSRPLAIATDGSVAEECAERLGGASLLYTLTDREAAELLAVIACGRGPDLVPELTTEEGEQAGSLPIVPDLDDSAGESQAAPGSPALAAPEAAPAPVLVMPPALETRRVDIRIYGRVRVLVDGQELLRGLPDAGRQVLALLVVRGELTEVEGIEALGAGSPDQVWRSRFVKGTRGTRPTLRQALGDENVDPIPSVGGVFRLNPDVVSSDYGRLLAGRTAAAQTAVPEHRIAVLTRATEGIRDQPFGRADYNWLIDHQEQVRNVAIDTLSDLAQLQADASDLDAAIETLERAASIDPDPVERVVQQQITWQYRLGRKEMARDLYRTLRRQLSERCDREPSEETEALMESLESTPRVVVR